jgi:hypothetical protein
VSQERFPGGQFAQPASGSPAALRSCYGASGWERSMVTNFLYVGMDLRGIDRRTPESKSLLRLRRRILPSDRRVYFHEMFTSFFAIPAYLIATASKNRSFSVLANAPWLSITHDASPWRQAIFHFGRFSSTILAIASSVSTSGLIGDSFICGSSITLILPKAARWSSGFDLPVFRGDSARVSDERVAEGSKPDCIWLSSQKSVTTSSHKPGSPTRFWNHRLKRLTTEAQACGQRLQRWFSSSIYRSRWASPTSMRPYIPFQP